MTRTPRGRYTPGEIRALIEGYEELRARAGVSGFRLFILLSLADLDRGFQILTMKQRQAVLLVGQIGLPALEAARLLGISETAVWKRYEHALERLHDYLNWRTR